MGLLYYNIQTELVIEYKDKYGKNQYIYTNRKLIKDCIDDSVYGYDDKNFKEKIDRIIKNNTYNTILYQNGEWLQKSYKDKYKDLVFNILPDIFEMIRVYKKNTAYESIL